MGDMCAFGVRTLKRHRPRHPRSYYFHLSSQQLNRLSKVVREGRQVDIVKAAQGVGLNQDQLKEAVRRWEQDKHAQWLELQAGGGGSGGCADFKTVGEDL